MEFPCQRKSSAGQQFILSRLGIGAELRGKMDKDPNILRYYGEKLS
jgi:hypothetical protein